MDAPDQSPTEQSSETPIPHLLTVLWTRFYTVDWYTVYYIGLFLIAMLTRFINLGNRTMSHYESIYSRYSWDFYIKGEYTYVPLLHGPLQSHVTALIFRLFGDNDFTARLYPATLGVILVMLPKLLFERWLGKYGAMATSFLLLISPTILYYSRYNRDDIPAIFFVVLMVYALFGYLDGYQSRQARHVLLFAAALLLAIATSEIIFFHVVIFFCILLLYWLFHANQRSAVSFKRLVIGIITGTLAALLMIFILSIIPLNTINQETEPGLASRLVLWSATAVGILTVAIVLPALVHFRSPLPWCDLVLIGSIALITAIGLTFVEEYSRFVPNLDSTRQPYHEEPIIFTWLISKVAVIVVLVLRFRTQFFTQMRQYPVFDLLIVLGTFMLPLLAAIPLYYAGYTDAACCAFTNLQPGVFTAYLATEVPLVLVSITIGLCWRPKLWLTCAAVFFGLFVLLFTTFFTNPNGIVSGLWGAVGYLLVDQSVRAGSQPQYYYMLTQLPVYEYLPAVGSLLAGIAGISRFWCSRRKMLANMHSQQESLERLPFVLFIGLWAALIQIVLILYGRKMPWLTVNAVVPMIFLTGWYIGQLLSDVRSQ